MLSLEKSFVQMHGRATTPQSCLRIPYDVFLSHSARDKAIVRAVVERLKRDGLKVWFDEWVLKPGHSITS